MDVAGEKIILSFFSGSYVVELEYKNKVVYCLVWLVLYKHTLALMFVLFLLTFNLCFHINIFLERFVILAESNLDASYLSKNLGGVVFCFLRLPIIAVLHSIRSCRRQLKKIL